VERSPRTLRTASNEPSPQHNALQRRGDGLVDPLPIRQKVWLTSALFRWYPPTSPHLTHPPVRLCVFINQSRIPVAHSIGSPRRSSRVVPWSFPPLFLFGDPPRGNQKRFIAPNGFGWISNSVRAARVCEQAAGNCSGDQSDSAYSAILSVFSRHWTLYGSRRCVIESRRNDVDTSRSATF
jgi:hypothetical protein